MTLLPPGKTPIPLRPHRVSQTPPGESSRPPGLRAEVAMAPQPVAKECGAHRAGPPSLALYPSGTPWRPSRRPSLLLLPETHIPIPSRLADTQKGKRTRSHGHAAAQTQRLPDSRGARNIARLGALCLPPLLTLFRGALVHHFLPTGPAARASNPVPAAALSCLLVGSGSWRPGPRWRRPARRGSGCSKRRT